MPGQSPSVTNIALVGGGDLCKEVLEKTNFDSTGDRIMAPILAVVDPDPNSPGMTLARELGLLTFSGFETLYESRYSINLIIVLTSEEEIFRKILETRPKRIRILSHRVFEIFWNAIGQQEKKLRERNREVETILNGIQDFILVITPDMEIVEVNEAFLTKTGNTRESVLGRKCHEVYQTNALDCAAEDTNCPLRKVIRNKTQVSETQTRVGRDGEMRYYEVNIFPIWEKSGKISKFIHISRDVTQRKRQEEEITRRLEQMVEQRTRQLKETHQKLLHQDKMSSLGKLSASVVHEINNPIAGILNLILLMKRVVEEEQDDRGQIDAFMRYLDLMETETRRISRIVSNLLAFSRLSRMEMNRLDINQLIERTLVLNANQLKLKGVKVHRQLADSLPELIGSADQIQQVFMNLVSNAAEAMENAGGGELSIQTRFDSKQQHIQVYVKDSGIGIDQQNFSKLFEPFFTTKKKGKGVGLGLSVAYGIVKEHGGVIFVDSQVGKGTTFRVELPLEPKSSQTDQNGGRDELRQNTDR